MRKEKTKVKEKKKQFNKGITLIALIITIIVLLIIAGVSIGMLTGDGGIIGKANDAKLETEKSDLEEQINTIVIRNSGDYTMDKDKLLGDFEEELPDGKEIEDSGDLIYIIYPDYSFEVDLETGKVTPTEVEKVEDETPWELAGSGTEADPYLIESIEDLVAFSNSSNENEGAFYSGKYVKLTRNLDFNSSLSYDNPNTKVSEKTNRIIKEDNNGTAIKEFLTSGTGFNPIREFWGDFDGNGKIIKEVYINRPNEDYVGMFGILNGPIKNIGITGKIKGNEYVGGISGRGSSRAEIQNSFVNIEIEGDSNVAGISGNYGDIKNCYVLGNLVATKDIAGISGSQGKGIYNCYNLANITTINEGYSIGGISGGLTNIVNCYNLGNINACEDSSWVGGIAAAGNSTSITNCYNMGKIKEGASQIGGILGLLQNGVSLNNNYYLEGTAEGGIEGKDVEGQAMPLPESEMPSVISVLMTDNEQVEYNGQMVDVWKEDTNNINNGYPILYWQ